MNVTEHVNNNQKAYFQFFRFGVLFYKTDSGLLFEIPAVDVDNGTFNAEEKAITLMKWIRRQLEKNEKARVEMTTGA